MHNPTKPTTPVTIGETTYQLLFDFEAIATAEDLTGRPLLTGLSKKDFATPTISLVRAMLYACLLPTQPQVTMDDVKGLITRKNLYVVWGTVISAWAAGMSEPEEDQIALDPTVGQS